MSQTKNVLKRMMSLSLLVSVGFAALLSLAQTNAALAAVAPNLLSAGTYSILAGTQVTNTGPSAISGDVGISPGAGAVGANHPGLTAVMVGGTIHDKDVPAANAQFDEAAAYTALDGLNACTVTFAGAFKELAGATLVPGVYCATSFHLSGGTLTLSGLASDTWVFKSASDLIISGGAAAKVVSPSCDVWWRVVSSATFDAGSSLIGNILADTSITLAANASLSGKAFARTAEVTLSSNIISACVAAPAQGSITIVKNTIGGNGTFNYTGAQSFSIITALGTGSNATAFASVAPGTYGVTETVPAGWNLTGLTCTNASIVNVGTATANVAVAAGEAVTCTFSNTLLPPAPGSITIVKNTVGGNGTFNYTGAQSFSIITALGTGSNATAFGSVAAGTYNVTETVPAGWNLTGLTCTNASIVNVGTATANVAVAAGEAVTCTFTNTLPAPGSITIVKNTVGGNGTFNYTGAQSFSIITAGLTGSNATAFASVVAGTYNVTETVLAGWNLTGLTCSNASIVNVGTATANVAVAAGEAVTCTFTNVAHGSIKIVKNTVGGNGTFDYIGAQSFSIITAGLTGSDATAFGSVAPGTYIVKETVPAGWNLTGLTCSNASIVNVGTATANVAVAAGEAVTCTFTNTPASGPLTATPTLSEWGMIIFMVLAGLVSIYYLRRRRAIA